MGKPLKDVELDLI